MRSIIIFLVRAYQYGISPLHPPVCRFQPTCSEYFIQAVDKKGILLGVFYGLRRLLRCHPLGGHGYDPVDPS
ncbi:MAG: membrane protein insertion efficiency factor YidD [Planctomycetes bacterium]|nr:membrane protein insertion efficiency factor YidD [Planctomycetota bacterium]